MPRLLFVIISTILPALLFAQVQAASAMIADTDRVIRRDGLSTLSGSIVLVDDRGVTIRTDDGQQSTKVVLWDQVRDVESTRSIANLDNYLRDADQLWRARSRLERGDSALAEPIFERLFNESRGKSHETALIIAEGLLRCRLNRMANELAVIPALEVIRIRRGGVTTDRYSMMPPVFDETFELCPLLPPTWIYSPRLVRLDYDLEHYNARGDEVVAAYAAIYQHALRIQHDVQSQPKRIYDDIRSVRQHIGVQLLRDMTTLIDPAAEGADRRQTAEQRLQRRDREDRPWIDAWHRYFLGLSLMLADGEGRNELGVAMMAHVPNRYLQLQPYLAGLAFQRIISRLERLGRTESAASVREELLRRLPQHPAANDTYRSGTSDQYSFFAYRND